MHPVRRERVLRELKDAIALSMTAIIEIELGNGAITNTLVFNGMPALLFEAEGKYIVKCLPLNQIGVGDSHDQAFESLGVDLVEAFKEALDENALSDVVRDMLNGKAAPIYWEKYIQLAKKKVMPKKIERRIENIELTTDTEIDPALIEKYKSLTGSMIAAHGQAK